MRGIGSIFRRDRAPEVEEVAPVVDRRTKLESMVRAVYTAPAEYNRETRRRVGMLSRIWRWDVAAFGNPPQAPRYLRRHYARGLTRLTTRRGRRERARSLAIAGRKGII